VLIKQGGTLGALHQWIKIHAIVVPTIVVPPKIHHLNPNYSWLGFGWTSYSWLFDSKYPAIVGRP